MRSATSGQELFTAGVQLAYLIPLSLAKLTSDDSGVGVGSE